MSRPLRFPIPQAVARLVVDLHLRRTPGQDLLLRHDLLAAQLASAELPRFAYVPFGGGARVCIGAAFAWIEGTLALVTLLRRWTVALAPAAEVRPVPRVTLRPSELPMTMRQRPAP